MSEACVKMSDMTTASVHRLPELDPTTRTINRTIKALIADREMTPEQFKRRLNSRALREAVGA